MTPEHIDSKLQYLIKVSQSVPKKYYGIFADGNLLTYYGLRVYSKPRCARNALMRALGIEIPIKWYRPHDYPHKSLVEYVDKLIEDKIIEIKQL